LGLLAEDAKAVEPWHDQVQQQQVWSAGPEHVHGLSAIARLKHPVSSLWAGEQASKELQRIAVVIG
jgi:hypothetical protein